MAKGCEIERYRLALWPKYSGYPLFQSHPNQWAPMPGAQHGRLVTRASSFNAGMPRESCVRGADRAGGGYAFSAFLIEPPPTARGPSRTASARRRPGWFDRCDGAAGRRLLAQQFDDSRVAAVYLLHVTKSSSFGVTITSHLQPPIHQRTAREEFF